MALLHAQNFEAYDLGEAGWGALKALEPSWTDGPVGDTASIVEPGWNAQRAVFVEGDEWIRLEENEASETSTLCFQGAFKLEAIDVDAELIVVNGLTLYLAAGGLLRLSSSNGDHAAVTGAVSAGQWHYLEIKAQIGNSNRVLVRIDGAEVFDALGVRTSFGSTFLVTLSGADSGCTWSECLLMDGSDLRCNDLLGPDTRIALLRPLSVQAGATWTGSEDGSPSSAALATLVDDEIPGGHDGVETAIVTALTDQSALFAFEPPPEARAYEHVQVLVEGIRTDESPGFAARLESSTVVRTGSYKEPTVDEPALAKLSVPLNPRGAVPWTRATLGALRSGVHSDPVGV